MIFKFNCKEVAKLIDEVRRASSFSTPYNTEEQAEPELWLVKDYGVYLMHNGDNWGVEESKAVFANGHSKDDAYIWGDDYVETIPISWFDEVKDREYILIEVTDEKVELLV